MNSQLIARGTLGDIAASNVSTPEQFSRFRDLFEQTFAAARVGIWVCSLPDEKLTWTDTVFDLFDIDPEAPLRRDDIVSLYTPASREALGAIRSAALREGDGFTLDAEIVTPKGNRRWIRITAVVERVDGVATRIFGMKQDITAEKTIFELIRRTAEVDPVTQLASRAKFEATFEEVCASAGSSPHGLLLIDLDGFKTVNDRLGHQVGDSCLAMAGRKISRAVPGARLVARLGGDEFVILHPCASQDALRELGNRIVAALEYWWGRGSNKLKVTASVGAAMIGNDAVSKDVFALADQALYRVKAEGKGGLRLAAGKRAASAA